MGDPGMSGLVFGPRPQLILGALAIIFGRRDGTRRLWNFEGGDYGPFASFTRSGAGTAFTTAGMIQTFASNVPRVTDKGLLLEGGSTNLLTNSVFNGGGAAPTSWSMRVGTGSSTPIASTVRNGGIAYSQAAAGQRPFIAQNVGVTTGTSTSSFIIESVSGGLKADNALAAFPGTASFGTVTFPVCSANPAGGSSGVLSPGRLIYTIVITANGTIDLRIGVGVQANANGALTISHPQFEIGSAPSSVVLTTTGASTRGADSGTLTVPAGCTKWEAVYGDARTVVGGSGLVPGASFDLVASRPWIGLGNELKNVRFAP